MPEKLDKQKKLPRFGFPSDEIRISPAMRAETILSAVRESSPDPETPKKVKDVYGDLAFPRAPEERPYTFGSLVLSMDGKIAYQDRKEGPLIAKLNARDPEGGKADFWVLNMLRAYAECAIIGARTLQAEPEGTSHVFCEEMARARVEELGRADPDPWNCIVSFDCTDIPMDHMIFTARELKVQIGTSPEGLEYLEKHFRHPWKAYRIDGNGLVSEKGERSDYGDIRGSIESNPGTVHVFVTGGGKMPDAGRLLYALRRVGISRALVESPSYLWHLMHLRMQDELFLNYSSVFVGGGTVFGGLPGFTAESHPHSDILTLGYHRANFFFTRQKLSYDL